AILVLPGVLGEDRGPAGAGVAQAAARALDPGDGILHMRWRMETQSTNLPERSQTMEVWLAPGDVTAGRALLTAADGTVLGDQILRPSAPALDLDFVSAARTQIENGTLRPVGRVTADDRTFERFRDAAGSVTWDFEAETLEPARVTYQPQPYGSFAAVVTVLDYERLDDTMRNRALLAPPRTVIPQPRIITPDGEAGRAIERP
ncbi:MAG: hypothetical protein M3417_08205, partial [Actinomycetota bacterium]|nr:hypothetical protein [Actinomycetota bacterium]